MHVSTPSFYLAPSPIDQLGLELAYPERAGEEHIPETDLTGAGTSPKPCGGVRLYNFGNY